MLLFSAWEIWWISRTWVRTGVSILNQTITNPSEGLRGAELQFAVITPNGSLR
jgi:hypothetical protein